MFLLSVVLFMFFVFFIMCFLIYYFFINEFTRVELSYFSVGKPIQKPIYGGGGSCFDYFLKIRERFYEIRFFSRKYRFPQISHLCHENKKDAGRPYESFPGSSTPRSLF